MPEYPAAPDPEKTTEEAAAEWLLRDDPAPADNPAPPVAEPGGESFALADRPEPIAARSPVPPPPSFDLEPSRTHEPEPERPAPSQPAHRRLDDGPAVDHPWSRWSEWGPNLAASAAWAIAAWTVIYFLLVSEMYGAALVAFAIGTVVGLALLYPIAITLERPTRVTPEQAARDYYQALSHHLPHYRRMWLLLSNAGRTSSRFASLEGFKRYWKERLGLLRQGKAGAMTPLTFVVVGFKSEKSGGKTEIDATWTIQVFVRGRRDDGPIWSFPSSGTFAKGPDNMWYLDDGTLAERSPE